MKDTLVAFLKGLCIGGTFSVPGVSGGAMAILLNIYDRMVFSLNSLIRRGRWKDKLKCLLFLASAALGGLIGFALLSKIILFLLEKFPLHTLFLFAGTIGGGIPAILTVAGIRKFRLTDPLFVILGAVTVVLISMIPEGLFTPGDKVSVGSLAIQTVGGFVLAFGLVLPGISFSQMLHVFGLYETVSNSLNSLNILPLIPIGVGGVVGLFATSFGVEKLMKRFPRQTYLAVFGFLLGSIPEMFRGVSFADTGVWDWLLFLVLAAVGAAAMAALFFAEKKLGAQAKNVP